MNKNNILRQDDLTEKQLQILNNELESKRKSVGVTYLLWLFLGVLGIHKFYLGKRKRGIIYPLLSIVGWVSYRVGDYYVMIFDFFGTVGIKAQTARGFEIFGIILLVVLGLLLLWDLYTIPKEINKLEEKLKEKIISVFEDKIQKED